MLIPLLSKSRTGSRLEVNMTLRNIDVVVFELDVLIVHSTFASFIIDRQCGSDHFFAI